MGKTQTEEPDLSLLEKRLIEKKKLLLNAPANNDKNGGIAANAKKISREEKEKIRKAEKKKRRKQRKHNANAEDGVSSGEEEEALIRQAVPKPDIDPTIEVEYVEKDEYLLTGKYYDEFKHVFQHFAAPRAPVNGEGEEEEDQDQNGEEGGQGEEQQLSRKKKKMLKRLQIAQLKAQVKRPDVVEVWDTTARDPLTLVFLKSYKNTVPVPRHWSQKRKFLQNKRGILKPPFKLPEHIEKTGIAKLRDPFNDKEAGRLVKQKLRERMNPKLGKIDIDYEVLHNAFFKFQEKPNMSRHGDVYYEGKEDEVKMNSYRPGKLSEMLRQALGISEFAPAPWVVNMQRYGPPPSYPYIKIPGLNAPLPGESAYGGRLLDEHGRPMLYGREYEEPVDKTLWGEPMEEDMEDQLGEPEMNDTLEPRTESELRSGISSVVSGMETPDIDLQKRPATSYQQPQPAAHNPKDTVARPLYQVLETTQTKVGANIYGSTHGYVIPGSNDQSNQQTEQPAPQKETKEKPQESERESRFKF